MNLPNVALAHLCNPVKASHPEDLSEKEWKLLQLLATYCNPFYLDDAYENFISLEMDQVKFYELFFKLQYEGYLRVVTYGLSPMTDIAYRLTDHGKATIRKYIGEGL